MREVNEKHIQRFWEKVDRSGGSDACWPWMAGKNQYGYGGFRMGLRMIGAHQLAYQIENGEIPDGLFVCHHCDNPSCCNPSHLFLGTNQDNVDDMVNKGRHRHGISHVRGEKHGLHKLSDMQVFEIRRRYATGAEKLRDLAKDYGVNLSQIWKIVNNKQRVGTP